MDKEEYNSTSVIGAWPSTLPAIDIYELSAIIGSSDANLKVIYDDLGSIFNAMKKKVED